MKARAPSLIDGVEAPRTLGDRHFVRIALALVLAVAHIPTLAAMARPWTTHPYAGHGLFVPVFSAMFLWLDRDRLRAAALKKGHP